MNKLLFWIIVTIIFSIISFIKQKYFLKKDVSFIKDTATIVKTKKKYIKTIDEQKKYIRAKNNLGKDFITMVFGIFTFYIAFITMLYPRIPDLRVGIGVVIVFAIIFAFVYAKLIVNSTHIKYHVINAFMNYLYVGFFLIYSKFVYQHSPFPLLIISIIVMIITNLILEKVYGNRKSV